nr:MAG TPA: hypothetical protein [Caudoviricetes sp.]
MGILFRYLFVYFFCFTFKSLLSCCVIYKVQN